MSNITFLHQICQSYFGFLFFPLFLKRWIELFLQMKELGLTSSLETHENAHFGSMDFKAIVFEKVTAFYQKESNNEHCEREGEGKNMVA